MSVAMTTMLLVLSTNRAFPHQGVDVGERAAGQAYQAGHRPAAGRRSEGGPQEARLGLLRWAYERPVQAGRGEHSLLLVLF